MREVSNRAVSRVPKDILIVLLVLTSSSLAFGLGMLAERQNGGKEKEGFRIEQMASNSVSSAVPLQAAAVTAVAASLKATPTPSKAGESPYVASKNGETYYLTSCKSADRIKPENRLFFATEAEAKASGRRAAANCPGL